MLQIISLLLENKPGALMRVTGLLTQRGYNIESLTVARTLDPALSRMTIVVDVDSLQRAQVIKQMNKLINVLQANDLTESPAVIRELVLLRIRTVQESRTAVLKEAEIFGGRVVDSGVEGFAIEVTGDPEKLGEFVDVMSAYGEVDVTRSGALAIALDGKKLRLQPPVSTVGQNTVGQNTVGQNTVGQNTAGQNTGGKNSMGQGKVGQGQAVPLQK